jgi:hypothetical protein
MIGAVRAVHFWSASKLGVHHHRNFATLRRRERREEYPE